MGVEVEVKAPGPAGPESDPLARHLSHPGGDPQRPGPGPGRLFILQFLFHLPVVLFWCWLLAKTLPYLPPTSF